MKRYKYKYIKIDDWFFSWEHLLSKWLAIEHSISMLNLLISLLIYLTNKFFLNHLLSFSHKIICHYLLQIFNGNYNWFSFIESSFCFDLNSLSFILAFINFLIFIFYRSQYLIYQEDFECLMHKFQVLLFIILIYPINWC